MTRTAAEVPAADEHRNWQELAALDALGMLEGAEAVSWQRHLAECAECQADAVSMVEITGELAYSAPPAVPAAGLRDRIFAQTNPSAATQNLIVRAGDEGWGELFPGIFVKTLSTNPATGDLTSLVRVAAGTVYAPHRHAGSEHCYVIEGELVFEDHTLHAGDYSVSQPGTIHTRATSTNGCMLLIVHNVRDEVLQYA